MKDDQKVVKVSTRGDTTCLEIVRLGFEDSGESDESLESVDLDPVEVIGLISELAAELAKTDLHRKINDFIHREAEDLFDDLRDP